MKFEISRGVANDVFTAASKVLAPKNTMPILDSFLFKVSGNRLSVTSSDGEKFLVQTVDLISSDSNFEFCANAKMLSDGIKNVGEQPVKFVVDGMELSVEYMNGKFTASIQDAGLFPIIQTGEGDVTVDVESNTLTDAINYGLYATANDEIRLVMTGIYLDAKPDGITFAATDGRKLVKYTKQATAKECAFIIPKKVCSIIKAILPSDRVVSFNIGAESVTMRYDSTMFVFRQVEGRYPNYNAVIPQSSNIECIVERSGLIGALKRVNVFCNKSSGLIAVETEDNEMRILGQDLDFSTSAKEKMTCTVNGSIRIGMSCEYLIEMLNSFSCDHVALRFTDPARPIIVEPSEQKEGERLTALLMPMQLN